MNKKQLKISKKLLNNIFINQELEYIEIAINNYCIFMEECRKQEIDETFQLDRIISILERTKDNNLYRI